MTVLRSRATLVGLTVGVPLSAVLLWLAFRNADSRAVRSALADANPGSVALAIAAIGCVYLLQAARWRMIARTPDVSVERFGEMVVSGVAINNLLPGRVGDLLRARWLQVDARIPGGRALATVFVDRAFDVVALTVFLLVSLPLVASAAWLARIVIGALALVTAVAAVLLGARLYARRRTRGRRTRGLVRRVVRDTIEGLADPFGRRSGGVLVAVSVGAWAMWAVAAMLVTRALSIELSPMEAIFLTSVVNLGVAIPSSPGFIGTYQWLAVSALALFAVPTDQALAFSILMHAVWYVPTLIVGGLLLVRRAMARLNEVGPARVVLREPESQARAATEPR